MDDLPRLRQDTQARRPLEVDPLGLRRGFSKHRNPGFHSHGVIGQRRGTKDKCKPGLVSRKTIGSLDKARSIISSCRLLYDTLELD